MKFLVKNYFRTFFIALFYCNIILFGFIFFILYYHYAACYREWFNFITLITISLSAINIQLSLIISVIIIRFRLNNKNNDLCAPVIVNDEFVESIQRQTILPCVIAIIGCTGLFSIILYLIIDNASWLWIALIAAMSVPITISCYICCVIIPIGILKELGKLKKRYCQKVIFMFSLSFVIIYAYFFYSIILSLPRMLSSSALLINNLAFAIGISFYLSVIIGVGTVLLTTVLKLMIRLIIKMI